MTSVCRRIDVSDSAATRDGGAPSGAPPLLGLCVESAGQGEAVLMLHGFTGDAESMAPAAAPLERDFEVHRIELVGHGRSDAPRDVAAYTMPSCVAQLVAVLDALEIGRAHLYGYSMGGRAALSLAAAHPDRVRSLVLVGATAGLASAEDRAARRAADEAWADRIERDGLESFVDAWMALPIFASQKRLGDAALARSRAQRLRGEATGYANSLRGMGTGSMPPLHAALPGLAMPVCLVVGEEDAKFRAIASDLAASSPDARVEVIAEAGHAAHLEQPSAVGRVVTRFLREIDPERHADPSGAGAGHE
jgi:2-succinyl-6-hydroxy-2,4-cyclohexadiene-1-carboxylate synthase